MMKEPVLYNFHEESDIWFMINPSFEEYNEYEIPCAWCSRRLIYTVNLKRDPCAKFLFGHEVVPSDCAITTTVADITYPDGPGGDCPENRNSISLPS